MENKDVLDRLNKMNTHFSIGNNHKGVNFKAANQIGAKYVGG